MSTELTQLGATIQETDDGFIIDGPQPLTGATVHGHDDHRIAMSLTVAGLVAADEIIVRDAKCAGDSFPGFSDTITTLGGHLAVYPEDKTQ
jgi:3-phosphoshikimate 1-carboxyvinyltransferase